MSPSPATRHRWDDVPLEKVTEMVARKVIDAGGQTVVQAYLKRGALVPWHRHAGPQVVYVLQGALRASVAGDDLTIREGELLTVPAGAAHQMEAMDDTFVLSLTVTP